MTDHPTPATSDDAELELVSAYLDGEATAGEIGRVEADPALVDRVRELGLLTGRLAADDAPAAMVDGHVARAMAAFGPSAGTASVTTLSSRQRPWFQRIPLGAVAAAVVVAALVGTAALIAGTDDGTDTATADPSSEALSTAADEFDADAGRDGADDHGAGGSTADDAAAEELPLTDTAAPESGAARLAFADTQEFADFVRSRQRPEATNDGTDADPPQDSAEAATSGPADPCDAVTIADERTDIDPATVEELLAAIIGGRDVTAVIVRDGAGGRLVVVDDATCDVIDDRRL